MWCSLTNARIFPEAALGLVSRTWIGDHWSYGLGMGKYVVTQMIT